MKKMEFLSFLVLFIFYYNIYLSNFEIKIILCLKMASWTQFRVKLQRISLFKMSLFWSKFFLIIPPETNNLSNTKPRSCLRCKLPIQSLCASYSFFSKRLTNLTFADYYGPRASSLYTFWWVAHNPLKKA